MKIIYEHGDVVYNSNNFNYGIVLKDNDTNDTSAKIIECTRTDVFITNPSKQALKYCGHINLVEAFQNILRDFAE